MKSFRKTWDLTVLWDRSVPLQWPWMALTLEPNRMSMYNIHSAACPSGCYWQSGLSHLQRRCHCTILGGSFELCSPVDSSWHFGRRVFRNSLCLFTATPCDGSISSILGGVSNRLFKAWKRAWLAVRGSLLLLWEWFLWTAAGDTIGLSRSSSWSSGREHCIAFGRVWCWCFDLLIYQCFLTCQLDLLL